MPVREVCAIDYVSQLVEPKKKLHPDKPRNLKILFYVLYQLPEGKRLFLGCEKRIFLLLWAVFTSAIRI